MRDGFDGGWFPLINGVVTIVGSLVTVAVLEGVTVLLVRFLLIGTRAAQIYIAKNAPLPRPVHPAGGTTPSDGGDPATPPAPPTGAPHRDPAPAAGASRPAPTPPASGSSRPASKVPDSAGTGSAPPRPAQDGTQTPDDAPTAVLAAADPDSTPTVDFGTSVAQAAKASPRKASARSAPRSAAGTQAAAGTTAAGGSDAGPSPAASPRAKPARKPDDPDQPTEP